MDNLNEILNEFKFRIDNYSYERNTIKGKLDRIQEFKRLTDEFLERINVECRRLEETGVSKDELKIKATDTARELLRYAAQ